MKIRVDREVLGHLAKEIIDARVRENDDVERNACWKAAEEWATRLMKIAAEEYP